MIGRQREVGSVRKEKKDFEANQGKGIPIINEERGRATKHETDYGTKREGKRGPRL